MPMRYRALTQPGQDYSFGQGPQEFLVNTPQTVAQAIQTALLLYQGSWFLDVTAGMPWLQKVIGYGTQSLYDSALKTCILGVEGVASIVSYSSFLNIATRQLTVNVTVNTIYGVAAVTNVPVSVLGYGQMPFGGPGPFGGSYTT
jgi:hypothetical protein